MKFSRAELSKLSGLSLSQIITAEGYGIVAPATEENLEGNMG
jgi:hypothetical protein